MTTPLMTSGDVARLLGKTPQWVERQAAKGHIDSLKVGRDRRFTDAHFAAYIDRLDSSRSEPSQGNPWGRKTRT